MNNNNRIVPGNIRIRQLLYKFCALFLFCYFCLTIAFSRMMLNGFYLIQYNKQAECIEMEAILYFYIEMKEVLKRIVCQHKDKYKYYGFISAKQTYKCIYIISHRSVDYPMRKENILLIQFGRYLIEECLLILINTCIHSQVTSETER